MKHDLSGFMNWMNHPQTLTKAHKASRSLAILLGILTAAALILMLIFLWPMLTAMKGIMLFELLDEMDDVVEAICFLAGTTALFAFISRFLGSKSKNA